jgi:hypothetical protein
MQAERGGEPFAQVVRSIGEKSRGVEQFIDQGQILACRIPDRLVLQP